MNSHDDEPTRRLDDLQPDPEPDGAEATGTQDEAETLVPGPLRLAAVAHSEIGLVRKNNQDSGYLDDHLLVVADGMGGAAAGDLASAVAIAEVRRAVVDPEVLSDVGAMHEVLAGIISRANDRIADLVAADHSLEGMGTTVDAGLFNGSTLALAHIGDSRAYLLRDGTLERLTHDHSWVQNLVDEGRITAEDAKYHQHRSLLLKVLNGQPANDPDLSAVEVAEGDRLLFCSDGLCGLVDDDDIAELLSRPDREDALEGLIAAAHAGGGIDNITILIADVEPAADVAALEPQILGAATEVDVPSHTVRPRTIDLGDGESAPLADDEVPKAPEPAGRGRRRDRAEPEPAGGVSEEDRYALQPPPPARRRILRGALVTLVLLLVAAGIGAAAVAWGRTQYFVADADDRVAIYQGLPDEVAGLPLNRVWELQQTQIADLPLLYQQQVRNTITVADLAAARDTVDQLAVVSAECIKQREDRATASAAPSPSGSATPRPTDSGSPSPTPSTTVRPEDGSC